MQIFMQKNYSGTNKDCKNCEAFQTQWKSLQNEFTGVKFAQVDVDTEEGEDTASRTGALVGIPHVRLQYHGSDYYSLRNDHEGNGHKSDTQAISAVIDSDADDYFEIYARYDMDGVNSTVHNGHFGAFRVTGA